MAVYTRYGREPKRRPDLVADVVPWRAIVAPGVVLQKHQHALQRTYAARGPDILGLSEDVQGALMLQANQVLKRLGGQWMWQSEALRRRVMGFPTVSWSHPVAAVLDAARQRDLLHEPGVRETDYYVTLTWLPQLPAAQRGLRWLLAGPPQVPRATEATPSLQAFVTQADFLLDLLKGVLAHCRPLTTAETLTYLHTCVSERWYPLGELACLMDLDLQLCDTPFVGGWNPQLGGWHLRTCSLRGYPATSSVGVMRTLEALDFDFRWCTRWLGMEKHLQEGMLRRRQQAWVGNERSAMDHMAESVSHQPTRTRNTDATNKADEVDAARQEVGADFLAYGQFTSTITVWDAEPDMADDKVRMVRDACERQGFTLTRERQHATAAWLSSHPGNRLDNVRRTPQHSLTLSHLCPGLTASWPGPDRDAFLQAGPWFYALTDGRSVQRIVNHVRDVGHHLVLGATGAGKSTLANFLRLSWMQYPHAQAKLFDLDGHGRLLTLLLGGSWYDLGSPTLRFQPLRRIDDPLSRGLAVQWLLDLLEEYQIGITAPVQAYLGTNLDKLVRLPPDERTLSRLVTLMADGSRETELKARAGRIDAQGISHPDVELRQLVTLHAECRTAIKRWTVEGEFGGMFDGTTDVFDTNPIQTFELRDLLRRPRVLGAVLRYLIPQLELQMSTERPMLLQLDDAAIPWAVPKIKEASNEWLMTTRKKAVSLGFMSHSLEQIFSSPLGVLLEEGCPTRFFLPNPSALEPKIHRIYAELGLTDGAIRTIATARPQRDVYYACTELGQRVFHLPLSPLLLDCLARNRAEDHQVMETLLAQEGREGFAAAWLRHHGHTQEAQDVETWQDAARRRAAVAGTGCVPGEDAAVDAGAAAGGVLGGRHAHVSDLHGK
jgi:type IV secretion system protein VirB4